MGGKEAVSNIEISLFFNMTTSHHLCSVNPITKKVKRTKRNNIELLEEIL